MKKVYLLLLIFIVFSCKSTPQKKIADDPGLSQLDLTSEKEEDEPGMGFDDEPQSEESYSKDDALSQDGITDEITEIPETKTDDLQADARKQEQQTAAVEEKKEPPEVKPPAPPAKPVQPPPPAVTKEEPPVADTPAAEKPAEEKQDTAQSESDAPQTPPPRYQPWITPPPAVSAVKDDAPVPNRQVLVPPKEDNVFSRTVRVTVGQLVDIPFRGNNWSYLEDIISRRGIVYNSRRNDSEGMIFTFRAEEAGTYALRFYRRDYIRDYILYDYVQVIVEESPNKGAAAGWFNPPNDRGKVTAEPRWPSALEEAAMLRGGARSSSGDKDGSSVSPPPAAPADREPARAQGTPPQTASANRDSVSAQAQGTPPPAASANRETPARVQGTVAAPSVITQPPAAAAESQTAVEKQPPAETQAEKQEKLPPEEILKKAQDAFNGGDAAAAIALLDQYTGYYPGGNDELYWMYGQFYEANTPQRNILLSLDYYRRLVNEYPQSRRYNDARRRIAYLERFYINIQ